MRPTLWLVVLVFSRTIAADSVLGELIQAGMKQKTMRLGGTFSESNIERLARAELKKRPRVNFIKLTIFGEKAGTPLPKPDHVSYDSWKGLYELAARSSNEIAEMISIGDNAVLRVRESNGKVTSKMLTGTNPLEVMISGDLYQIVYLALSPPGQYIAQGASVVRPK